MNGSSGLSNALGANGWSARIRVCVAGAALATLSGSVGGQSSYCPSSAPVGCWVATTCQEYYATNGSGGCWCYCSTCSNVFGFSAPTTEPGGYVYTGGTTRTAYCDLRRSPCLGGGGCDFPYACVEGDFVLEWEQIALGGPLSQQACQ